jgi:hypothetical protein
MYASRPESSVLVVVDSIILPFAGTKEASGSVEGGAPLVSGSVEAGATLSWPVPAEVQATKIETIIIILSNNKTNFFIIKPSV